MIYSVLSVLYFTCRAGHSQIPVAIWLDIVLETSQY